MYKRLKMTLGFGLSIICCWAYAVEMKDPTKPSRYHETVETSKKNYRLESILLGSERKLAIINGHAFSEGDDHQLGKVMAIKSDHVVLQGSKRHILKLNSLSIKKNLDKK